MMFNDSDFDMVANFGDEVTEDSQNMFNNFDMHRDRGTFIYIYIYANYSQFFKFLSLFLSLTHTLIFSRTFISHKHIYRYSLSI